MAYGKSGHKGYWAALPAAEAAPEIMKRVQESNASIETRGEFSRIAKAYQRYYGESDQTTSYMLSSGGERGELSLVYVNTIRYLVQHVLSMVGGQRLAYKAVPANTDIASKEQSILCDSILEYFTRKLRLEKLMRQALEFGIVMSKGYVEVFWDSHAGEEYGVDENGVVVKTGDVGVRVFSLLDVIRDQTANDDNLDWVIVREYVNRYDLAAKYPEHAEKICEMGDANSFDFRVGPVRMNIDNNSDRISLYKFYVERTPAVPDGREMLLLDAETVLTDGPLSYTRIPVFGITPGDVLGSPNGYTPVFDMLGPSDACNYLLSTILTNTLALGVNNVLVPRGSGIRASQLAGGLNVIEYDMGLKPEVLQLGHNLPDILPQINMYLDFMMQSMGTNAAAMGNIDTRLSGTAIAQLDAKALQFASVLQESYTFLAENVGQTIFELVRDRATSPRIVKLLGANGLPMARSFVGADLEGVERVHVEITNPMAQTSAMRMEDARLMLEQGLIRSPEQYMEVKSTGQTEGVLEGPRSEMLLVREENERMRRGESPPVLPTDNHPLHLMEHKPVMASPDIRDNPDVLEAYMQHILAHVDAWRAMDPEVAQAMGIQPSVALQQSAAVQRGEPDAGAAPETAPQAPPTGAMTDVPSPEASGEATQGPPLQAPVS